MNNHETFALFRLIPNNWNEKQHQQQLEWIAAAILCRRPNMAMVNAEFLNEIEEHAVSWLSLFLLWISKDLSIKDFLVKSNTWLVALENFEILCVFLVVCRGKLKRVSDVWWITSFQQQKSLVVLEYFVLRAIFRRLEGTRLNWVNNRRRK